MILQLPTPILPKITTGEFPSYPSCTAGDWWVTSAIDAIFVVLLIGVAIWIVKKGLGIRKNLHLKENS